MANPTTNYGFVLPTPTDLVTDLPADFDVALQGVDTQMLTNANAAIAKTIVDAKGDIIAATGADAVSRLVVGANDTILTADSATATGLKWAAASAGGMTVLASGSLSGSSVDITSISGSYTDLKIVVLNCGTGTDGANVLLRFNGDANSNRHAQFGTPSVDMRGRTFSATFSVIGSSQDNAVFQGIATCVIPNYANTTTWKIGTVSTFQNNSSNSADINSLIFVVGYNQTVAITSLTILADGGGTFTNGTYILYGVK